jgi:hypothetical protein
VWPRALGGDGSIADDTRTTHPNPQKRAHQPCSAQGARTPPTALFPMCCCLAPRLSPGVGALWLAVAPLLYTKLPAHQQCHLHPPTRTWCVNAQTLRANNGPAPHNPLSISKLAPTSPPSSSSCAAAPAAGWPCAAAGGGGCGRALAGNGSRTVRPSCGTSSASSSSGSTTNDSRLLISWREISRK